MGIRDACDCDICGARDVDDPLLLVVSDEPMRDAPGSVDIQEDVVWLCAKCQRDALISAFTVHMYHVRQNIVVRLKSRFRGSECSAR